MTDIRVAAEQARVALQLGLGHTQWAASRAHFEGGRKQYGDEAEIIKAALASLEAALAAQPSPVEAQAVPDQPVAWLEFDEYAIADEFPWVLMVNKDHPAVQAKSRIVCFTRPTPAAADLHQQSHSDHLAAPLAGKDFRDGSALSTRAPSAQVTEFNVGRWCMSEDDCIAAGIDFAAYERGVSDAAKAFSQNAELVIAQQKRPKNAS